MPEALSFACIHPVPKPGKDNTALASYRPITIGSTIAKVFESCILLSYGHLLTTSSFQYGFKAGVDTAQCTLAVKAVARHFTSRGSRVYAALLDASKAFDRSNYARIFQSLLYRGLPSSVVHLLYKWYTSTKVRVSWNSSMSSKSFELEHGVRQGGLLSPVLFAILYDELILLLQASGLGCHIGSRFVGTFAYADDLILLAPSLSALNNMLKVCHDWSHNSSICFNPAKSVVICLHGKLKDTVGNLPIQARLGNTLIASAKQVTHLGHLISADLTDSSEVIRIAKAYNRQFHAFFSKFRTLRDRSVLIQLYKTYCTSFYGLESIFISNCSSAARKLLTKSVNLSLMKLLNLPRESISQYLIAHGILNAEMIWKIRQLSFWSSAKLYTPFHGQWLVLKVFQPEIDSLAEAVDICPILLHKTPKSRIWHNCLYYWMQKKNLC